MKTYRVEVVVSTQVYLRDKDGHLIDHPPLKQVGARELWKIRAASEDEAITYARHYIARPHEPGDNEIRKYKNKCECVHCLGREE